MRLARISVILTLVVYASCEDTATSKLSSHEAEQEKQVEEIEAVVDDVQREETNDPLNIVDSLDSNNGQLPILPPIILLDFANDLENSSSSSDDKSKRTIDSSLGYGFGRNNLFTGKYNYYFPAGKSGTTVSIEESISPFLPKTIIETVKPITEKPYPGDTGNTYGQNPLLRTQQNNYQASAGLQAQRPTVQVPNNRYLSSQPIFGQRTKLYKPSQIDYSSYQTYSSTPKSTAETYTTPRPDYRSNSYSNQNIHSTPKPSNFQSGFPQGSYTTQRPFPSFTTTAPALSYVTPTSSHQTRYGANPVNSYTTPRPSFDGVTTSRPPNSNSEIYSSGSPLASFSHLPRYTIENGVRYENKIVWKYPDGKVSQTPPTSYINAYNEFLSKQKIGASAPSSSYQNIASSTSFQTSGSNSNFQSPGTVNFQNSVSSQTSFQNQKYQNPSVKYQNPQQNRYPAESLGNIYSKSPAQFPNDQQPGKPSRPSQFVSSATLTSAIYGGGSKTQQAPPSQSYEQLSGYQGQFGLKTSLRTGFQSTPSPSSGPSSGYLGLLKDNTKTLKGSYDSTIYEQQRPIPKYAVNSPDAEYTYSTDSPLKSTTPTSSTNLFTPSGSLSPNVLSKYTPQAQKYLTKVFASGPSATSSSTSDESYGANSAPYVNTNYENLLNYNPSISQYIRNPSSILNAQPTFIQAGNSLIPVIILRVDGAPPIQPKVAPNINLKALLQQYLTQYAGSISQNQNYDYNSNSGSDGKASNLPSPSANPQNPLYELAQLAQSLTQYSQNPSIANSFGNKFENGLNHHSYDSSNSFPSRTSYEAIDKTGNSDGTNNYGTRASKPQKVKSVQIIEDPRFTSYKVNS